MQLLGRPVNITRDQLNAWLAFRAPSAPKNFGAKIWDACANTQVNPSLMACIALIKSKKFLSGQDIFACGIQGTLEDQIVNAVNRYAVMDPEELMLAQSQSPWSLRSQSPWNHPPRKTRLLAWSSSRYGSVSSEPRLQRRLCFSHNSKCSRPSWHLSKPC